MTWWQETFDTRVGLGDYLSAGYEPSTWCSSPYSWAR